MKVEASIEIIHLYRFVTVFVKKNLVLHVSFVVGDATICTCNSPDPKP